MNKDALQKRNMTGLAILLVIALGPLALLTLGPRFATDEMERRAEAAEIQGEREQPGRYPDRAYGLPNLVGAAAGTTVLDITRGDALFQNYNRALREAGFQQVLRGPGPLTVVAPTDKAFEALPPQQREALLNDRGRLTQLLSNHIVRGELSATDLLQRDQVKTLGGKTVPIRPGGGPEISFGNADIVRADFAAGNGVVHFVDSLNL